jgi:type IX secretion system PorP/SprF family membrane protein
MMVSYVQKSINWDNLVFTDQLHAVYGNILPTSFVPPTKNSVSFPDFSVGGVYRFNEPSYKFTSIQGTIGVAYHHVFRPNESFLGLKSPLPSRLSITGDVVLEVDPGGGAVRAGGKGSKSAFKFNPGVIYEKQAEFSTLSLGLNVLKSGIYAGVWYRNEKFEFFKATDVIFSVGVNAPFSRDNRAKLMYSYDFIVTELRTAARATHEVSLVLEMDKFNLFKEKRRGPRNYRNSRSTDIDYTSF